MGRKGCAVFQALVNWMSDGVCVVHVCLRSQEAFYVQETTVCQNIFLMVITCINSPPWFESIHICHCDKVHLHIYTSSLHFFETLKKKNHKKKHLKKYRRVIWSSETTGNMSCISVQQALWTLQLMILLMVALAFQCILCALFYLHFSLVLLTFWAKIQM